MFIPPFRVLNVSISPRLPDKYFIKLSRMFHHIQLKGQNIIEKYYILLALRIWRPVAYLGHTIYVLKKSCRAHGILSRAHGILSCAYDITSV